MPRGRPRRESTGSVDSSSSSKASPRRRARSLNWKGDSATRLSRSSIDVVLAWLTAPGNLARWAAARSHLDQRLVLCREINAELRSEGIAHRQDMDIYHKLGTVERSFLAAKKWLEETALLPRFLDGKAGKDVEANVRTLCPYYKELALAFRASKNASAAATVVDIDDDDDGDEEEAEEEEANDDDEADEDGGDGRKDAVESASDAGDTAAKASSIMELVANGSQDVNNAANDSNSAVVNADAVECSVDADGYASAVPLDMTETFALNDASPPEQNSIVRDSASSTPSSNAPDGVSPRSQSPPQPQPVTRHNATTDLDEETKANDPPQRQAVAAPASASKAPPKQLKRLRQRLLPQPQLTDDELSSQGSPGHFKTRTRSASLSASSAATANATATPPPTSTVLTTKASTTAATPTASIALSSSIESPVRAVTRRTSPLAKQTIAPKRKTSSALRNAVAIATSSAATSTATPPPPSGRKRQKTAAASVKSPIAKPTVESQVKSLVAANGNGAPTTSSTPSTAAAPPAKTVATMHPDELAAVLRACEDEREQRHTLFALACDKLMQELEEKKVQVVYETARARQKLLAIGVAQSEIDRILPL